MSNTVDWRAKPRTSVPNSRQKRNGLFLDSHPVCEGCWSALAEHAHHMFDRTFSWRIVWYAMRGYCEPCHVLWHRPLIVRFQVEGTSIGRAQLAAHQRIQFILPPLPAGWERAGRPRRLRWRHRLAR